MAKKTEKGKKSTGAEQLIVENLVSLQKILADLSIKMNETEKKFSRLLDLFENASKSYERPRTIPGMAPAINDLKLKEISIKIDTLLDQNKEMVKALTLIESILIKQPEPAGPAGMKLSEFQAKPLPESNF